MKENDINSSIIEFIENEKNDNDESMKKEKEKDYSKIEEIDLKNGEKEKNVDLSHEQ